MAQPPILSLEGLGLQQGGRWLFGGPKPGAKGSGGAEPIDLHVLPGHLVAARDFRHRQRRIGVEEFQHRAIARRQAVCAEIAVSGLRHGAKQAPNQPDDLVIGR